MKGLRTIERRGVEERLGGMVHARVAMCWVRRSMPAPPAWACHPTRAWACHPKKGRAFLETVLARPRFREGNIIAPGRLAVVLAALLVPMGCSRDKENGAGGTFLLADNGIPLPEFALIRADGKTVSKADFIGTVWVADFIFTTCAGPCPELTLRMRSLQKGLEQFGSDAKSVSFTVDPAHDKPAVLRAYAKRFDADPSRWWFLTSNDEAAMHELVTAGFLQALSPSRGGSAIIHSTRFVLVDKAGRIRGWYDGLQAASKAAILRAVETLLREPTGT